MLRSCSVTQLFQGSCFRPVEYRSAGKSLRHVGEDDKCGDMLLPLPGSFTEDSHDATVRCCHLLFMLQLYVGSVRFVAGGTAI